MFLKMITWGSNHFADRIPYMCMMEIMLHCYSGFAFGQPIDTLWFSCILTIILTVAVAVLTAAGSVLFMCMEYVKVDVCVLV